MEAGYRGNLHKGRNIRIPGAPDPMCRAALGIEPHGRPGDGVAGGFVSFHPAQATRQLRETRTDG